jgi:WD40 repeat protein/tRNA A-37 threonylcarbamoyl transferase component Bud32
MSERSIFLNALDRTDPAERAAYLDQACAGRPDLRRRIERLLQTQVEESFLEVSAPQQLARGEQALTFLAPPREAGSLGRLDHYDVLEVVGRGATGVVLKARDAKLQRVVALKVLAPRLAARRPARERFVREAQATAAVRDDNVIAIYAVSDEGPLPYLVMEFIAGSTLEDRIRKGGPLKLPEVLRIGMQVASGLAAAHAQGLIHRDIKPANILLENGVQRVKITDFGLAQAAAGVATERGVIAGTPSFMAPCQVRGEAATERSDLFSLGSVMYALCTGRPPFGGDTTAAVLKSVCEDTPRPIRATRPDLPEGLCDLVGKLLAKNPGDRFGSAREVAGLLTGQLARLQQPVPPPSRDTAPTDAPPAAKPGPVPAKPSTWRARLLLACLVVLLAGLATLAAVLRPWRWVPRPGATDATEHEGSRPAGSLDPWREDLPPVLLAQAGGDPAQAPRELAAVLGDGKYLLPRVGQQTSWPEQSPDGRLLAVPIDEDVVLFEVSTGKYLRSLKGPGGSVVWVNFSRDSGLLAATTWRDGRDGAVRVWDLAAGRELYTHPQPVSKVSGAAAFSPDNKRLVTEEGKGLRVWDARSGEEVQSVELPPAGVPSLSFRPDGRSLAVALGEGRGVKVFDWDGEMLGAARMIENRLPVQTVTYSPDGEFLAGGDSAGFKLWNAETLKEVRAVATPAAQLAFAPDGRTVFATWSDGQPKTVHAFTRWDVRTGKELPAIFAEVAGEPARAFPCLSRDGKVLFVAQEHEPTYVQAIDTATGKELFPRHGHSAPLNAVAVSPDGHTVASAGEDRVVMLWDLAGGRVLRSLDGHREAVWGIAFSPDGQMLATASRDGTIVLWDVASGVLVRELHGSSRSPSRVRFSPDGTTLAGGGKGGIVMLWDVVGGKEGSAMRGHGRAVRGVAYSRDGKRFASGSQDETVLLYDRDGGRVRRQFTAPAAVNDVAFSPDGRTLAAVCDGPGATVWLWDVTTGQETMQSAEQAGPVFGLAFSPTAPLLATCGADGTVRLWDRGGTNPAPRTIGPGPFGGPVRSVAFTPDGRYLLTANANGLIYALCVGDEPAK